MNGKRKEDWWKNTNLYSNRDIYYNPAFSRWFPTMSYLLGQLWTVFAPVDVLRDGMTSYMSTLKHGRFTLTDALLLAALKGKECTVQKKTSENKDSRCWNDRVTPWKQKPGNYHYIAKILIIIFKTLKLQRQTTDSSLSSKILFFKVICKRTAHASVWILEQF